MSQSDQGPVWSARVGGAAAAANREFCAGRDVRGLAPADAALVPYDLACTRAHDYMLYKQDVLSAETARAIFGGLAQIESEYVAGKFQLQPELEDVHMNIETRLGQLCGVESAGRSHTGRSRNDQVDCDLRMYARDRLVDFADGLVHLVQALLQQVELHRDTVMPGLSHRQLATVTSWGHWLSGYAQGFLRDLERVEQTYARVNRCSLGAAAGYGTSWPLDRELTAQLLGFDGVLANTLDCVSARPEWVAEVAFSLGSAIHRAARLGQDLILFSSLGWKLVELPDDFVTGSSIMPQKKNPDLCEVMQAKAATVEGLLGSAWRLMNSGPGGYNREHQWTKYWLLDLWAEIGEVPHLLAALIPGLKINVAKMREAAERGFLNAVDLADALARDFSLPFRTAYKLVAEIVRACETEGYLVAGKVLPILAEAGVHTDAAWLATIADPEHNLAQRRHQGAPAPAAVAHTAELLDKGLKEGRLWVVETRAEQAAAKERLLEAIAAV